MPAPSSKAKRSSRTIVDDDESDHEDSYHQPSAPPQKPKKAKSNPQATSKKSSRESKAHQGSDDELDLIRRESSSLPSGSKKTAPVPKKERKARAPKPKKGMAEFKSTEFIESEDEGQTDPQPHPSSKVNGNRTIIAEVVLCEFIRF